MNKTVLRNLCLTTALVALGAVTTSLIHDLNSATTVQIPPQVAQQSLEQAAAHSGNPAVRVFVKPRETFSGAYLASLYAQQHHDWDNAYYYMNDALELAPDPSLIENHDLLKRAMVLGIGSGYYAEAFHLAQTLSEHDHSALPLLFLTVEAFKQGQYEKASQTVHKMPAGSVSDFIIPLLDSWSKASSGQLEISTLNQNAMHYHHAVLIADYMGKTDRLATLLNTSLQISGNNILDIERIADGYTHVQAYDKAQTLYQEISALLPQNKRIADKIAAIRNGEKPDYFEPATSPQDGVARALYDMALILFQEHSDESAQVFGHMALYLNPAMTEAKVLLAGVAARSERFEDAIAYYRTISRDDPLYLDTRLRVAGLLEEDGQYEASMKELQSIYDEHHYLDALIQLGDLQRRQENYPDAIHTYTQAARELGESVPGDYWTLLYTRGMAYEQNGQWELAEQDLKAALEYQPNDPYILNYLGYAWADRNLYLKKSLDMIMRAVSLAPDDGYITDSLGWVYFRMGEYHKALPHLERAVELQPYDPIINDHLGDVYWKLGRKLEARFQWMRAQNSAEDDTMKEAMSAKLEHGLKKDLSVQEAKTELDGTRLSLPADHNSGKTF